MALRGTQAVRKSFLQVACLPACSRELWKATKATLSGRTPQQSPRKDDKVQTLYTNSEEAGYAMGLECKLSTILKDEFHDFAVPNLVPAAHANPILFLSKNPVASVLDRFLHGLYYPTVTRRYIENAFQVACHRMAQLLEIQREDYALLDPSFAALFTSDVESTQKPCLVFHIPPAPCALA